MPDGPAPDQIEPRKSEAPISTPEIKREGPPVVPEIKNNYGTESPFQVTVDGMKDDKWQYAIRVPGNSDASYPRGRLLMTPDPSKKSDGIVINFDSMDEAIDFALAKNRAKTAKGWTDSSGDHHESTTVHYDPRILTEEAKK